MSFLDDQREERKMVMGSRDFWGQSVQSGVQLVPGDELMMMMRLKFTLRMTLTLLLVRGTRKEERQ